MAQKRPHPKIDVAVILTARQTLLREAERITSSDRNKSYGPAEDNFTHIADMWQVYLRAQGYDVELHNYDVAQMMILLKVARLATNPLHADSMIDIAGYAACGAECVASKV